MKSSLFRYLFILDAQDGLTKVADETLNGISFLYFRQRIIANGRQALLFLPIPKNTRCSGRKLILHKK